MFVNYTKTSDIVFKHAKGMRDVKGKEFHAFNEIFLLIGNTAEFTSNNSFETITPYSLIISPKEQFHQFDPIGDENEYCRYVLQFDDVPGLSKVISDVMSKIRIITSVRVESINLFKKLEELSVSRIPQDEKCSLLYAIFTEILFEIKYHYSNTKSEEITSNYKIQEIIKYIEAHYLEEISIKSIAKDLNFSETVISHTFKKAMNISVYNYILKKKLTHAYTLIKSGYTATEAAIHCGFAEYSGFYKMFLKYFGISPSKIKQRKK